VSSSSWPFIVSYELKLERQAKVCVEHGNVQAPSGAGIVAEDKSFFW
jgi:hypothetical protein